MMIPAETERLVIRRMSVDDVEDFLAYQTLPEVMRYQSYEPATRESATRFLTQQAAAPDPGIEGGYLAFAVHHKRDGKMIGEVSIEVSPKLRSHGGIGWSFHPEYHGQGYASEATRVLLAYGFSILGLHRLTTYCDVRNVASYRLMERLGMRREGLSLKSMLLREGWQDAYYYALLQEEWQAMPTR